MSLWSSWQDLRLAVRIFRRQPTFSVGVIALLAMTIGLVLGMVTIADAVLRRPLAVRDQDRLVVLWGTAEGALGKLALTPAHFDQFRREARTLQEVAGTLSTGAWPQTIRDGHRTLPVSVGHVTGNFFDVLGTPAVLGRMLTPQDDVAGAAPVGVISYRLWTREFAGDRGVIGRPLTLHERELTFTIVGVAPSGVEYPAGTDLWVPLTTLKLEVVPIGRLARGATPGQAASELRASFQKHAASEWRHLNAGVSSLPDLIVGDMRPAVIVLTAAAMLLLLIGCANIANLLVVRASGRAHELAIRRALGAGRARILRQLLTENSLLAIGGGIGGAVLASLLVDVFVLLAPPDLPRLEALQLTRIPAGVSLTITTLLALVFGIVPTFPVWRETSGSLHGGHRSVSGNKRELRGQHVLVIAQVTLAVIVSTAAGLLARSLQHLSDVNIGFRGDRVAMLQLAWPEYKFESAEKVINLYERLVPTLEALPGIAAAAPVNLMPFTGAAGGWDGSFVPEGRSTAAPSVLNLAAVGAHFFRTLDVTVLEGRAFMDADRGDSLRVAIVSETVARRMWPNEAAVGRRIGLAGSNTIESWWTVVGIVPEVRYRSLREPTPTVYLPYTQFRGAVTLVSTLAVRATGDPANTLTSIRRAVAATDPTVLVANAASVHGMIRRELAQPRLSALLLITFGLGALFLVGSGLYAVLAFSVRRRSRELAIRHVLGAAPSHLRWIVLGQGSRLVAIGAAAGTASAWPVGRLLRSSLFGVGPSDSLTTAGVIAAITIVAIAASYVPARRAMNSDPAIVLREY